ncbi:MAG TPA: aryl-sulfate sulfotransferase, partial [Puia sp.]|nr:aryl-sulfate sulfotransferase [Puia sp.]
KKSSALPSFLVSDLKWGSVYFWKICAYDKNNNLIKAGDLHTFKIVEITTAYFDEVKLTVNSNKPGRHAGGFIAIDNTRTIFNRRGEPVWTLPEIPGFIDDFTQTRDLKMTNENTITLLANQTPIEIDFKGNVIWKGPSPFVLEGDTIVFHHDLKKDKEGNYYVLGNKYVYRNVLVKLPHDVVVNEDMVLVKDSAVFRKTEVGVLLKFDKNNNVLWYFDCNAYFKDIDLNFKKSESGFPNFNSHANAFSVNEAGTKAYIGFRDLSRIIKVDMKTKTVLATYGEKYPSGDAQYANDLFRSQHGANITSHHSILILNNNGSRPGGVSSVVEIKDTAARGDSSLVWRLALDFDKLTRGKSLKGGNVEELPNSNLFVCAGDLNRVFEVTRSKETVWDAFVYFRGKKDTLWQPFSQYRASVFNKIVYYHFMSKVGDTRKEPGSYTIPYTIFNTGNFSDKYLVELLDENNKVIFSQRSEKVGSNSSVKENLKFNPGKDLPGSFYLRVVSIGSANTLKITKVNFH